MVADAGISVRSRVYSRLIEATIRSSYMPGLND